MLTAADFKYPQPVRVVSGRYAGHTGTVHFVDEERGIVYVALPSADRKSKAAPGFTPSQLATT